MRKYIILLLPLLCACGGQTKDTPPDAAGNNTGPAINAYKPGLGEFMMGIQMHHAKLWFAGTKQNWPLAQYELDEIKEAIEAIKEYDTDRHEVRQIDMIYAPLDSMAEAVRHKDESLFRGSYTLLTNTCNNCHRATKHEFNVIKIPDSPPVTNQEF